MRHPIPVSCLLALLLFPGLAGEARAADAYATPADLGKALFFDTNLSKNRTQA